MGRHERGSLRAGARGGPEQKLACRRHPAAPPRSATRQDKEPVGLEENQETVARTRCCSAPPVLYTESSGVASLPSQGEDAIAPLASASHSPKNSDEWHGGSWNDDGK